MAPDTNTLNYWIARTLQSERERLGRRELDIAMHIPGARNNPHADKRTIDRIEQGQSWGNIEEHVVAYAYVLGFDDARDLWGAALSQWRLEGAEPEFRPIEGPAAAFAQAARDQGLRDQARLEAALRKRRASDRFGKRRSTQ